MEKQSPPSEAAPSSPSAPKQPPLPPSEQKQPPLPSGGPKQPPLPQAPPLKLKYNEPIWSGPSPFPVEVDIIKNGAHIKTITDLQSKPFITFGRHPSCDVLCEHGSISRQHAVIQSAKDGRLFLQDLGSTHGTFLDGKKTITNNFVALGNGNHIKFGESDRQYAITGLFEDELDLEAAAPLNPGDLQEQIKAMRARAKVEQSQFQTRDRVEMGGVDDIEDYITEVEPDVAQPGDVWCEICQSEFNSTNELQKHYDSEGHLSKKRNKIEEEEYERGPELTEQQKRLNEEAEAYRGDEDILDLTGESERKKKKKKQQQEVKDEATLVADKKRLEDKRANLKSDIEAYKNQGKESHDLETFMQDNSQMIKRAGKIEAYEKLKIVETELRHTNKLLRIVAPHRFKTESNESVVAAMKAKAKLGKWSWGKKKQATSEAEKLAAEVRMAELEAEISTTQDSIQAISDKAKALAQKTTSLKAAVATTISSAVADPAGPLKRKAPLPPAFAETETVEIRATHPSARPLTPEPDEVPHIVEEEPEEAPTVPSASAAPPALKPTHDAPKKRRVMGPMMPSKEQIAISQVSARVAEETKGNSPDEMSSHDANGFDIADEWVPPEEAQTL